MKKAKTMLTLSVVFALALALTLMAVACGPKGEQPDDGPQFVTHVLEDGTIAITGLKAVYAPDSHTLTIPETIDGRTVTQVTISKTYDSASGDYIVSENLSDLVLPDTVQQLGYGEASFDGMPGIARLNIPKNLRNITAHAFDDIELATSGIDGMSYLGTQENPYMVLWYVQATGSHITGTTGNKKLTLREETTIIGPNCLYNRYSHSYAQINILDMKNVTVLCDEALYQGSSTDNALHTVYGMDKVKYVGDSALRGSSMREVSFGADLESLGNSAFAQSTRLTNVDLSHATKLKTIGNSCFEGCTQIGASLDPTLTIPASVETIGDRAFFGPKYIGIVFGSNSQLKKIGDYAFANNSKLADPLELPEGLLSIGNNAFSGDYEMTSITIPASVTSIGREAFDPSPRTGKLLATFADTNGWGVSTNAAADRNQMQDPGLQPATNPNGTAQNGTALQSTHKDKYWKKA